ncbi:M20/M25/M40 family metallo-hydrolase [Psychroflexus sp. ALD_RP9]|uniref:M20/M25/M40 family metallo-hydrolase n=1 Tax=Psychroflexus sp. ALD_RP9 TaxID=2777186 RepID=UPI001A8D7EA1|nr:M20/M25/M40 family metallo-hydrolase [Psychroflexus sp. ALD_RP9]QSS96364.1 M20/M25/M40 family metallo-hydrolase [Psychroflexus sp. ALD_RP9]
MKKILLLLAISFGLIACQKATEKTTKAVTASAPAEGQEQNFTLEASLKLLASDSLAGRETGTIGIEKAADYIEKAFKAYQIQPYFETYKDSFQVKGENAYNIIGVVQGSQPDLKPIMIGAHYDHIGYGKVVGNDSIANGANDNATGTVAVLELAKHFSENQPKRNVIFTLFSAEEKGLLGAKHLAERFNKEAITPYFLFNIEMIGIPMSGKNYKAYLTGIEKSNFAEVFNTVSKDSVVGFLPQAKKMGLFMRSDNYPFYEVLKIPAHTVCTFDFTNFEYYHHVDDEFDKMNLSHLKSLINSFKPGLTELANSTEDQIKLN